jgi:AcrR family transcriptional regulator
VAIDDDDPESAVPPAWRNRAVERSLERSRAEAELRSSRFVSTALELVEQSKGKDFTVQDVVEKMRVSTRTFYQYFTGKDQLLLAMFEELQRTRNKALRQMVAAEPDPLARLRAFVVGCQRFERRQLGVSRLMVQQYFLLQLSHPFELRRSYQGVVTYVSGLIADAMAAGVVYPADPDRTAALLLQTVTNAIQMRIIGSPVMDPPATPEEVWEFCLTGLRTQEENSI